MAAGLAITVLAVCARDQASTWRDGITSLWRNAVECNTGPNSLAQNNLGNALLKDGNLDEAIVHLRKALEIDPGLADAHVSLGNAMVRSDLLDAAIAEYQQALKLQPDLIKAHINMGVALQRAGRVNEAIAQYQRVLEIEPDIVAGTHYNLAPAWALRETGSVDDGHVAQFQKALALQPGDQALLDNLSLALRQKEQAEGDAHH